MAVVATALLLLLAASGSRACGTPPSVSHATVQVSTQVLSGSSVQIATYTCDSANGYATRGNNSIACLRLHGYAIWTAVQVTCVKVQCRSAPYMSNAAGDFTSSVQRSRSTRRVVYYYYYSNGRRRGSYYVYSQQYYMESVTREIYYTDYVTFTCSSNYFLPDGSRTVRTYCGDQGSWIAPNITCQGKDCGSLPSMVGVSCTGSSTRYPNSKSCQCISGYERVGSAQFTFNCLSSGTWSGTSDNGPSSCTKINCGAPPVIGNSDREATVQTGTRYQDRVTYTCLPGYEVSSGSHSIHCQANKRWTTTPICSRKDCGNPPDIANGGIPRHLYNTTFDSEVTYSCDSLGYMMTGAANVRCSEDGTWSIPPLCHKVNCGSPPFVQNAERHVFGHSYNDTVTYECDVGYELVGESSITCQVIGHWTVPPTCQELSCGAPPEVENTENSTVISGTTVGSEARYTCITGYVMSGESVIECLTNQQWSTTPQCNRIRCGNPPQILNGSRRVYGHYLNDRTKYQCHTGYIMAGDPFVLCQHDGHWSVHPDCYLLTCGLPSAPDNGVIFSISGVQFGGTVTYRCLSGYITADPLHSTCQLDGQWSSPPNCTTSISTTTPNPMWSQAYFVTTWLIESSTTPSPKTSSTRVPTFIFPHAPSANTPIPGSASTQHTVTEENLNLSVDTIKHEMTSPRSNSRSISKPAQIPTAVPTTSFFSDGRALSAASTKSVTKSSTPRSKGSTPKPIEYKYEVKLFAFTKALNSSNSTETPQQINNNHSVQKHVQSEATHSKTNTKALVSCLVASVIFAFVGAMAIWYIIKKKRQRRHDFASIDNALYQRNGEYMTVYSFKGGH